MGTIFEEFKSRNVVLILYVPTLIFISVFSFLVILWFKAFKRTKIKVEVKKQSFQQQKICCFFIYLFIY